MARKSITALHRMKASGEKIACLTAYDYSFGKLVAEAGMDLILVGDSLGMVMQGQESTIPVTLEETIYHANCVNRGNVSALLVVDMPFMSYQESPGQALQNAGAIMKQSNAQMVKLEGGTHMLETIRFLVDRSVPVCGHLGLTPQSVHALGGYKVQGRDDNSASKIKQEALALQEVGVELLVLEAIPGKLAEDITRSLRIPTIGIGAGPECDGQILVLQDMLGIYGDNSPKFCKNFMVDASSIQEAISLYVEQVKNVQFPGPEHGYD